MNLAIVPEFDAPQLEMNYRILDLEKEEIESKKGIRGKLTKNEGQMDDGVVMKISPMSNQNWSLQAQSQFIA
jgi:hypothetical protein